MERIEREATIDSLRGLESYYQSKYEYYLAMANEAKENKERVGLLLLDLGRDVVTLEDNSNASGSSDRRHNNGSTSHQSLDNQRVNLKLPQAEPSFESKSPASGIIDEEREAPNSVEQMRRWTLDLQAAMSVIESVSNSDSGKALHQNYLHHLLNRELDIELSLELVELYLEEATRRGYLEPDEFNNNCYIAGAKAVRPTASDGGKVMLTHDDGTDMPFAEGRKRTCTKTDDSVREGKLEQNENIATVKASTEILSGRKSKGASPELGSGARVARNKPYELPPSDKLKPTLFETIEGYIEKNRPKRFSIDDVIDYLYPQSVRSDWNKVQRNKVRTSISNVLSRKAYLGKHWSRIKPGVYRPRTSK